MLVDRFVISAVALAAAYLPPTTSRQIDPITDPEAYAVYAAVLPRMWTNVSKDPLLLQQETEISLQCRPSPSQPNGEIGWEAVQDNFKAENSRVRLLRRILPIDIPYRLIPRAEIAADDARLLSKYPGSWQRRPESIEYAAVSAVGFDATKTKAIVHVHLRSEGGIYWIENQLGKWDHKARGGCFWIA
ncbi:MAG TPA: hypothetical protein VFT39_14645 [Vicinamibacterales bacterium]|nr:hypothetical protein [Vicinamibacterales bacterium]